MEIAGAWQSGKPIITYAVGMVMRACMILVFPLRPGSAYRRVRRPYGIIASICAARAPFDNTSSAFLAFAVVEQIGIDLLSLASLGSLR